MCSPRRHVPTGELEWHVTPGPLCVRRCIAAGTGLHRAAAGATATFEIMARDACGNLLTSQLPGHGGCGNLLTSQLPGHGGGVGAGLVGAGMQVLTTAPGVGVGAGRVREGRVGLLEGRCPERPWRSVASARRQLLGRRLRVRRGLKSNQWPSACNQWPSACNQWPSHLRVRRGLKGGPCPRMRRRVARGARRRIWQVLALALVESVGLRPGFVDSVDPVAATLAAPS